MNDNDYRKFGLKYIALLVKFIQKKKFVFQLKSSKLICVQMKLRTHKMQVQSTRLTTIYMEKSQSFFKECVRIKGIYKVDTRT